MDYSPEQAARDMTRLWLGMARTYRRAAIKALERGHVEKSLRMAQIADACYFQATGEADSILMPKPNLSPEAINVLP